MFDILWRKRIKAKGKPVELHFNVNTYFGDDYKSEGGEVLVQIIDKNGISFGLGEPSDSWNEISPGLKKKYEISYYRNIRDSMCSIRIQPEACPVILRVKQFHDYTTSDFPHSGEYREKYYSIRISK